MLLIRPPEVPLGQSWQPTAQVIDPASAMPDRELPEYGSNAANVLPSSEDSTTPFLDAAGQQSGQQGLTPAGANDGRTISGAAPDQVAFLDEALTRARSALEDAIEELSGEPAMSPVWTWFRTTDSLMLAVALEHYHTISAGLTNVDFVVDDGPLSWVRGDGTQGATLLGGSVFDLLGIGTAIHLFPDFFERGYAEAVLTIVHEAAHRFAGVGHGDYSVNSAEALAQYAGSVHRAHDRRRMRELAEECAQQLWEAYVGGAALNAPYTTEDGVELDGVLCGGARLEWFEAREKAHHDELFRAFEQGHGGDEAFTCADGTVLRSDLVGAMWQRWSS